MNFTKQDILKINAALQKLSVKDSAFPVAVSADSSVVFPVLKKGVNAQLRMDTLRDYVQTDFDLTTIPIEIDGFKATNIFEALENIVSLINNGSVPESMRLHAANISCYATTIGRLENGTHLQVVLDELVRVVKSLMSTSDYATTTDIDGILTTNTNR